MIGSLQRGENLAYIVEGGQIVILDNATGAEQSRHRSKIGFLTPIYPGLGAWACAAPDERIYGIIPGTGIAAFHKTTKGFAVSSTWNGENVAYFLTNSGAMYGLSISTRSLTWDFIFPRTDCSPITYSDNILYVGNADYRLYAVEALSGNLVWEKLLGAPVIVAAPVVTPTRVYAATTDGLLHAIDLETQNVLWSIPGWRVLTTTENHVILLKKVNEDNFVVVADSATGNTLAELTAIDYEIFAADPVGGYFYAVDHNGAILAIADRQVAEQARNAALGLE